MVGRESKRPLGPLFLTEAKFGCQTLRLPKRDIRHPICRGFSVDKWSASPAGAFTLLSLPLMGIYSRYFLDPDQGQTGPVSWEVAPLPPPRPRPYFQTSECAAVFLPVDIAPAATPVLAAVLSSARRAFPAPIPQSTTTPLDGKQTPPDQQCPARLNANGFQQDLTGASGC